MSRSIVPENLITQVVRHIEQGPVLGHDNLMVSIYEALWSLQPETYVHPHQLDELINQQGWPTLEQVQEDALVEQVRHIAQYYRSPA